MGRGEIQNRDAEAGLGELPDDIAIERGDLQKQDAGDDVPLGAPDALRGTQGVAESQSTDLGAPDIDYIVRATYDSRPINGYDFNITVSLSVEGPIAAQEIPLEFIVPVGLVCVLRRVNHFIEPAPPITLRSDVLMTITRGGVDVPHNVDIPVGIDSTDLVQCFVIANEGETVGIDLTVPAITATSEFFAHFYGNFLLKLGRPLAFEIANPNPTGKIQTFPTRDVLPPVQTRRVRRQHAASVPGVQTVSSPRSVTVPEKPAPKFRTAFTAAKKGR